MDTATRPLRIGGVTIGRDAAFAAARSYLSGDGNYGYPGYDAFDAGAGPWRLSDGDLLAPALLNVTVRIPAFYALTSVRGRLEAWLARVPPDARLAESTEVDLQLLAELFSVIDAGLPGVAGTTLAKVMHRKRPAFVPLYDRFVWRCYVGVPDAPVPRNRLRTWQDFVSLLAAAMKTDLLLEEPWLVEVASLASGTVPVSTLRALDIVAWQAGRAHSVPDEPADPDSVPS